MYQYVKSDIYQTSHSSLRQFNSLNFGESQQLTGKMLLLHITCLSTLGIKSYL